MSIAKVTRSSTGKVGLQAVNPRHPAGPLLMGFAVPPGFKLFVDPKALFNSSARLLGSTLDLGPDLQLKVVAKADGPGG